MTLRRNRGTNCNQSTPVPERVQCIRGPRLSGVINILVHDRCVNLCDMASTPSRCTVGYVRNTRHTVCVNITLMSTPVLSLSSELSVGYILKQN